MVTAPPAELKTDLQPPAAKKQRTVAETVGADPEKEAGQETRKYTPQSSEEFPSRGGFQGCF